MYNFMDKLISPRLLAQIVPEYEAPLPEASSLDTKSIAGYVAIVGAALLLFIVLTIYLRRHRKRRHHYKSS